MQKTKRKKGKGKRKPSTWCHCENPQHDAAETVLQPSEYVMSKNKSYIKIQ